MAVRDKIEPREVHMRTDRAQADRLDRKSLRGESGKTRKAVKKAEGKKPPREGMGDSGERMGRDRDLGKSLENAGQERRKAKVRST